MGLSHRAVARLLSVVATANALTLPAQPANSAVAIAQAAPETTAAPDMDVALSESRDYLGPTCGYVTERSGAHNLMTSTGGTG
jgi:hypothetical protein